MIRSVSLFILLIALLGTRTSIAAQRDPVATVQTETKAERIRVYFRNNTPLPRNITIVTYSPGAEKGEIDQTFLFPFQRFSRKYVTNTKIYLASPRQVEGVAQGKEIDDTPAAMTIRRSDEDEVYVLFRR